MPARRSQRFREAGRDFKLAAVALLAATIMSACADKVALNVPRQTVKIGLVAPFEGRYREIGVEVIPAARLAIQEWAARPEAHDLAIELVAYDDRGQPQQAEIQAQRLTEDDSVVVVIGHWLESSTQAALPHYTQQALPVVTFSPIDNSVAPTVFSFDTVPSDPDSILMDLTQYSTIATEGDNPIVEVGSDTFIDESMLAGTPVIVGDSRLATRQTALLLGESSTASVYITTSAAAPDMVDGHYWTDSTIEAFQMGFEANSLGAPPGLLSRQAYEATWLAIVWAAELQGIHVSNTPVDGIDYHNHRTLDGPYYVFHWADDQRIFDVTIP